MKMTINKSILNHLRAAVGDRLSTSRAERVHRGQDESHHAAAPPEAVAWPSSTEEVASLVAACARHRVPIVPF